MTPAQLEAVDSLIASSIRQCSFAPDDVLEVLIASWPAEAREKARERLAESVFYCDGCGWYVDAGERHAGDLCDECHDSREDGEEE